MLAKRKHGTRLSMNFGDRIIRNVDPPVKPGANAR